MSGILQGLLASFSSGSAYRLYSWGSGSYGMLGTNSGISTSSPVQIGALTDWAEVAAANRTIISTKKDGTAWVWGTNTQGALGLSLPASPAAELSSPVQLGALTDWYNTGDLQLGGGLNWITAVKSNGSIWAWGSNSQRQLNSSGYPRSSPVQLGASGWLKVSTSSNTEHAVAIATNNSMWAWGRGDGGRLGNNQAFNTAFAAPIGALTTWETCSAGYANGAAIKNDNTLWTWGKNFTGQLGDNSSYLADKSSPVQVGALTNWAQVSINQFCCAVKTDGTIWAWGNNNFGQLGLNLSPLTKRSSPVQIGALTNWSSVFSSSITASAVKTDGTLWTWGRNNSGQLGDGTTENRFSPIQVGSDTNWYQVSSNGTNTFAITKG